MPQGAFKSRKTIANKIRPGSKKAQKNNLKIKKNKTISAQKTKILESRKFKKNLEKAINARIEDDVKALASNEATSFKILKSSGETKKRK